MKFFKFKKKYLLISLAIIICLIVIMKFTTSLGMQSYYNTGFTTGLVTATTLNVRSGPGTTYKTVATVNKNEYIRVFAGVGDWYIVQVEGDYIGAVSKKYVKPIYPSTSNSSNGGTANNSSKIGRASCRERV